MYGNSIRAARASAVLGLAGLLLFGSVHAHKSIDWEMSPASRR
jgi:hypothetical protein